MAMTFPTSAGRTHALALLVGLASLAACKGKEVARGDSLQIVLTDQQKLSNQLNSQKDSLTRVVVDADAFLGQMDSAIKTVKSLPRQQRKASDPLADQLQARKDMLDRVNALVARTKQTAAQLAELQKKQAEAQSANGDLRAKNAEMLAKI